MPCGILAKEQVWFEKFWLFAVAVLALSSGFLGTGVMSMTYKVALPKEQIDDEGKFIGDVIHAENWSAWPVSMIIVGIVGFALATCVWNAKAQKGSGGH